MEETYKNQIEILKKQIELFERKFEQIDQDRSTMDRRTAQITQDNISKIRKIEREKDELIMRLQSDIDKLQKIIHQK